MRESPGLSVLKFTGIPAEVLSPSVGSGQAPADLEMSGSTFTYKVSDGSSNLVTVAEFTPTSLSSTGTRTDADGAWAKYTYTLDIVSPEDTTAPNPPVPEAVVAVEHPLTAAQAEALKQFQGRIKESDSSLAGLPVTLTRTSSSSEDPTTKSVLVFQPDGVITGEGIRSTVGDCGARVCFKLKDGGWTVDTDLGLQPLGVNLHLVERHLIFNHDRFAFMMEPVQPADLEKAVRLGADFEMNGSTFTYSFEEHVETINGFVTQRVVSKIIFGPATLKVVTTSNATDGVWVKDTAALEATGADEDGLRPLTGAQADAVKQLKRRTGEFDAAAHGRPTVLVREVSGSDQPAGKTTTTIYPDGTIITLDNEDVIGCRLEECYWLVDGSWLKLEATRPFEVPGALNVDPGAFLLSRYGYVYSQGRAPTRILEEAIRRGADFDMNGSTFTYSFEMVAKTEKGGVSAKVSSVVKFTPTTLTVTTAKKASDGTWVKNTFVLTPSNSEGFSYDYPPFPQE